MLGRSKQAGNSAKEKDRLRKENQQLNTKKAKAEKKKTARRVNRTTIQTMPYDRF